MSSVGTIPGISQPRIILKEPRRISCFSLTEDQQVHVNDQRSLKIFREPRPRANLLELHTQLEEAATTNPFHHHPSRLDRMLKMCLQDLALAELFGGGIQIVTWRGLLSSILRNMKTELNVSMFRGILFLEEYDPLPTTQHTDQPEGETIGYSWKNECTFHPDSTDEALKVLERFCVGMTVELEDLNVLYAGTVDCVEDPHSAKPVYFEFKSKMVGSKCDWKRWCMQSYLGQVQAIHIGYHIDGILQSHKKELISDIQARLRWDLREYGAPYRNLQTLRQRCLDSGLPEGTIWRAKMASGRVEVRVLLDEEVIQLANGEDRHGILPRWFVSELSTTH